MRSIAVQSRPYVMLSLACLCLLPQTGSATAQSPEPSPDQPAVPTLSVQTRLIVEDVLVTDRDGKPVRGLPQSAFHVLDGGQPQSIRSFEEGGTTPAATRLADPPLPSGTFTNRASADAGTVSEALIIDADDMELLDQMFLLQELRHAIATLPPGLQVAIFRVSNGRPVQIRGLTTDRDDLGRALGECLPVQTHAIDSKFESAVDQLLAIAGLLQQTPGRKSLVWFAGAFPLVDVAADSRAGGAEFVARERIIRQLQEALAEARVSVYPVDVRGVKIVFGPPREFLATEHDEARRLARVTGGKAYALNFIADEVRETFDLCLHAYTVAYTPSPYRTDESWHAVTISVDGDYRLSYRRGYLATWTGTPNVRPGTRLRDGKKTTWAPAPGQEATAPLLFTVSIEPEQAELPPAKRSSPTVTLRVRIPVDQLSFAQRNGRSSNQVILSSYAYNSDGKLKDGKVQELDTVLSRDQLDHAQTRVVAAEQTIALPRDAHYLLVTVRDRLSQRVGSLSLPAQTVRTLSPHVPNTTVSTTRTPTAAPTP